MINFDSIKKGDILGISSIFSKKKNDYVPIRYKVVDVIDMSKLPNIQKQGVSHIFHILSPKNKPRELMVFKGKNFYIVMDVRGKTDLKGKADSIKILSGAQASNGEFGVRWQEWNKRDQLVRKQKFFKTDKFIDKLEKKDNFQSLESITASKGVVMKNELKALYRKDKKLALEVAKVLGYKVIAKPASTKKMAEKAAMSVINFVADPGTLDLDKQEFAKFKKLMLASLIKNIEEAIRDSIDEFVGEYY